MSSTVCNPGPLLDYSLEFLASRGSTQKSSPMKPSHPTSPVSPLQLSSGWDTPYNWYAFSSSLHPRLSLPSTRKLPILNWICFTFLFGSCTGPFFHGKNSTALPTGSFQTQAPCLWWCSLLILQLFCALRISLSFPMCNKFGIIFSKL